MERVFPPGPQQVALRDGAATATRCGAGRSEGHRLPRPVASVARTSGGVSFGRRGDPEDWRPASVGLPVTTGDRLYTARGGRAELRAEAFEIHLAPATGLEAIDVTDDAKRFYVWGGSASFLVRQLRPGETFTVETPNATERIDRAGEYRIDADGKAQERAALRGGSAWEPGFFDVVRGPRPVC